MSHLPPRGIRNNNPGNLRITRDPWQGLAPIQQDPEFFTFSSMAYGVRAAAITLMTYYDRHGLRTVEDIIGRWAPPNENNTLAYVQSVAARMKRAPNEILDLQQHSTMRALLDAIFIHENGQPVPGHSIDQGLLMAGVRPPEQPLARSRTLQGTGIAGLAGTVSTAALVSEQVHSTVRTWGDWAPWIVAGLLGAGLLYVVLARLDDRRRGYR